ncbi:MAG: TMEM43 family protein [Muribaculaceae bacterium]|nr:TMEM43 family protein [Muribaculaceae bacterium]
MAYTETTTTSYGTRVGNSFKQIGSGFLMFIIGTVLLFWNEGRTIHREQDINFANDKAVEMPTPDKKDASLEGQLVHATGNAISKDILSDGQYPVAGNYTALKRDVEYYQWVERKEEKKRDKVGGGEETITTYYYDLKWVDEPVNSSSFHDPAYRGKNTVRLEVEDKLEYATNVEFGAYKLPDFFIKKVGSYTDANVAGSTEEFAAMLAGNNSVPKTDAEGEEATEEETTEDIGITETQLREAENSLANTDDYVFGGNEVYYGDPSNVRVGDVRITFTAIPPQNEISIMAEVAGDTFKEFQSKNGKFAELKNGKKTKDEMIQAAKDENNMIKWALRILGILLVIGGLKGIFGFLVTLFKVIPFLASIMNFGVGLICTLLGIAWSLIVIAVAWIFYRPVLGISLLVIAIGLIAFLVIRGKNKKPALQPAPAPGQQPMQQPYQAPQQPMQQPYQAPQQPMQQPYQAPQQPMQQPYQAPQQPMQQPYQAPQQPMQQPEPMQQPYQAPQQPMQQPEPMQQPYQAPQQPMQQAYQDPMQQPYQAPQQPMQQAYQAPQQPMQQPYQAPQQPMQQQPYQNPMQQPYQFPQQPTDENTIPE